MSRARISTGVLAFVMGCGTGALAQTPAQRPAQTAQPAAPQAQQPPAPPQQPSRTELLNFDNWTVTCQEFGEPAQRRSCYATLQVTQQGTANVVLAWLIAAPEKTRLVSTLHLPTGVFIAPGVDLKLGAAPIRKLPYSKCEPQRCEANLAVEEAVFREASAAETGTAAIQGSGGQTINISFPMKGFDKAMAALRK